MKTLLHTNNYSKQSMDLSSNPKQCFTQLQSLWNNARNLRVQEFFAKSNELLVAFLEMGIKKKVKKPDWRTVFIKQVNVSVNLQNKALAIWYFKIAAQLSKDFRLLQLIQLLKNHQGINFQNDNFQDIQLLKLNYMENIFYPQNYSSLEKLSMMVCHFLANLKAKTQILEEVLKHYLLGLIINIDETSKIKMNKIFMAAFESYCYFCHKHISNLKEFNLNIFKILSFMLKVGTNERLLLYRSTHNFISLIRTEIIQNFVQEFGQAACVPETIRQLFIFLEDTEEWGQHKIGNQLSNLTLTLFQVKRVVNFVDLIDFDSYHLGSTSTKYQKAQFLLSVHEWLLCLGSKKVQICQRSIENMSSVICQILNESSDYQREQLLKTLLYDIQMILNRNVLNQIYSYNFKHIQKLRKQQIHFINKWEFLFRLAILLVSLVKNKQENHRQFYERCSDLFILSLLLNYAQKKNKQSKEEIISFIQMSAQNRTGFSSLTIIGWLNQLVLSDISKFAYQCLRKIFDNFKVKDFLHQSKLYSSLIPFRFIERQKVQSEDRQSHIFISKTIQMELNFFLQAFNQNQNKLHNYQSYLLFSELVNLLGQNYDSFEEDSLETLMNLLTYSQSDSRMSNIVAIIARSTLTMIGKDQFCTMQKYQLTFTNLLQLLKKVLLKKGELSTEDKLGIVDLTFNLKSELYTLFSRLNGKMQNEMLMFIERVVQSIDTFEILFLNMSAAEFISQLANLFKENDNVQIHLLSSVFIKFIYFLIYPKGFDFEQNLIKTRLEPKDEEKEEYAFLQEEIQYSATILKSIKMECQNLENIFRRIKDMRVVETITKSIEIFSFVLPEDQQASTSSNLHDLIFIAYLTGETSLQYLLLSYRLSIIKQSFSNEYFLLELSRMLILQIVPSDQSNDISSYIGSQMEIKGESLSENIRVSIQLLLYGKINDKLYDSGYLFRIIYLLKNDPVVFADNFKPIIKYLCLFVFKFKHLPFDISNESAVLKMTKNKTLHFNKKQFYKQIWQEDWSSLQLLTIALRAIIKQIIGFNQLSKLRSLLKFSWVFLVRSGHLGELALPLHVLWRKKKEVLNTLPIADSLRKVVEFNINKKEYQKIDRVLCKGRKSVSCGLNLQSFSRIINNSFKEAGKIGIVLSQLFLMIVFDMLGANQWEKYRCKSTMSIYQQQKSFQSQKVDQLEQLFLKKVEQQSDRQVLCNKMAEYLFGNFKFAEIIRDYLSEQINQVLQNYQQSSRVEQQDVDKMVIRIAIIFQEYNFTLKQLWIRHNSISISECNYRKIEQQIYKLLKDYKTIKREYFHNINMKITALNSINYPLNIIFPLGRYLFNIACQGSFLVTFVPQVNFEDKLESCNSIINSNSMILKSKNLNTPINYKKRKGLDNQLGKVVSSTDIGVVDSVAWQLPSELIQDLVSVHPSLPKFIMPAQNHGVFHLDIFVKRFRLGNIDKIKDKIIQTSYNLKFYPGKAVEGQNLLYLHYKYLNFPFEGVQTVSQHSATYRLPFLEPLLRQSHKSTPFKTTSCKYLINTKNNLPETQQKFYQIKQKFPLWTGIVGRSPPLPEIVHLLDRDIYLYMGHGTGLEHIPSSQFCNFSPTCVMLVFGCSSSQMTVEGSEPVGCSFYFLMRGCPAYLGCLWNVTDVDLDRVTMELLNNQKEGSLGALLKKSRSLCTYPNLNGSSLAIYGLPCNISIK